MPAASAPHVATCVALALCSLPKGASFGSRAARGRARSRAAWVGRAAPRAGGGVGGGGVGVPRLPLVQHDGEEEDGRPAWLIAAWLFSAGRSYQMARKEAATVAMRAPSASSSFAGEWDLVGSDNFDAYLASMNVSAVHRRYACLAAVTHYISEHADSGGRTVLGIRVQNKLGSQTEHAVVGGPAVTTVDARGASLTKCYRWEPCPSGRACVAEVNHSVQGRMVERRVLSADGGTMTMELRSPAGVTALRKFQRRAAQSP